MIKHLTVLLAAIFQLVLSFQSFCFILSPFPIPTSPALNLHLGNIKATIPSILYYSSIYLCSASLLKI